MRSVFLKLTLFLSLAMTALLNAQTTIAADPDLRTLATAGRIIHSEVVGFETDASWKKMTAVMNSVDIFDRQVLRMMEIFCSPETNKSVLLVGEASDTYKYYFARLSQLATPEGCRRLSHVDFETSKLQGYMYVGTTEKKWEELIELPAYDKDVIIYFNNLRQLIGIGTSIDRSVGIESTYVTAMQAGRLKSVAFLNKYDYNDLIRSKNAYVLGAFQETIQIEDITAEAVEILARKTLEVHAPSLTLSDDVANYLFKNVAYYQPNVGEPQRTMDVLYAIMNKFKNSTKSMASTIATDKPYKASQRLEWTIDQPDAIDIKINFEYFKTDYSDKLTIVDGKTGKELDVLSGNLGTPYTSKIYNTSQLKLTFVSDTFTQSDGFKIAKTIFTARPAAHAISPDDVRFAIFEKVQVPLWMINRDYQVIRDFPAKLNDDVVGVADGKAAVVRQVKIGYVSGRTDEKPAGALLFVGPTGTGKSYLAKKTADYMGLKLLTFDMTQYGTEASFDRFVSTMANYLVLYPYAVYLFEEIDKADVKVLDRLYFMMDEGVFYDQNQRPLFARGALILMTTNAGQDVVLKEKDNPEIKKLVRIELEKTFRPSFLNRFDATPIFMPFTDAEFMTLAQTLVAKKIKNLKTAFDWKLTVDQTSINFIGVNGRSARYGARPMERLIESVISIGISEYQINVGTIPYGSAISITKDSSRTNGFSISVADRSSVNYEANMDINEGLFRKTNPHILPLLDKVFGTDRMD